jgi:hypothetical protein
VDFVGIAKINYNYDGLICLRFRVGQRWPGPGMVLCANLAKLMAIINDRQKGWHSIQDLVHAHSRHAESNDLPRLGHYFSS